MIEFCTSLAVFITITALIAFFIACCTGYFWNSFFIVAPIIGIIFIIIGEYAVGISVVSIYIILFLYTFITAGNDNANKHSQPRIEKKENGISAFVWLCIILATLAFIAISIS